MAASEVYREFGEVAWAWVAGQLREDDGPWLPEVVPDNERPAAPDDDRDSLYAGIGGLAPVLIACTPEFSQDEPHETPAAPTEEDLLVLYLDDPVDDAVVRRLTDAGGTRVTSRNPYWDRQGATIADPDGYRLVLSGLSWP